MFATKAPMKRLEFFIDGEAIGRFLNDSYPSKPGRYRYEPYRGEGHAKLVESLRQGTAAICSFSSDAREIAVTITQEIFVPATPESYWFIDIKKIEATAGVLLASDRSALLPITCLGITRVTPNHGVELVTQPLRSQTK